MAVSGVTGSTGYTNPYSTITGFARQLNQRFSAKLKIKSGHTLTGEKNLVQAKASVLIAPELLNKAISDGELSEKLDSKLAKIVTGQKAMAAVNTLGKDLGVQGYTIDRSGNIKCHGMDNKTGKDFTVELGNVKDSDFDILSKFADAFDVNISTLLFTSHKW